MKIDGRPRSRALLACAMGATICALPGGDRDRSLASERSPLGAAPSRSDPTLALPAWPPRIPSAAAVFYLRFGTGTYIPMTPALLATDRNRLRGFIPADVAEIYRIVQRYAPAKPPLADMSFTPAATRMVILPVSSGDAMYIDEYGGVMAGPYEFSIGREGVQIVGAWLLDRERVYAWGKRPK